MDWWSGFPKACVDICWIFAISEPKPTRKCNVLFQISVLGILNPPKLLMFTIFFPIQSLKILAYSVK